MQYGHLQSIIKLIQKIDFMHVKISGNNLFAICCYIEFYYYHIGFLF